MVDLPGAGRADQRDHLAGLGAERDAVQHLDAAAGVERGDLLQRGQRHLVGRRVGEADVVELDRHRARRAPAPASGFSAISGFRSSTSKTRSKLTSALITSTRALASAVSGAYSRVSSSASGDDGAGVQRARAARSTPPSP